MKTSEKLISITCGPEGNVVLDWPDADKKTLAEVIEETQALEREGEAIKEVVKKECDGCEEQAHEWTPEGCRYCLWEPFSPLLQDRGSEGLG